MAFLPALLTIVGGRIDRLSWRRGKDSGGRTRRWVRTVQRRPILMAAASTLLLLILCVPALFLRIGSTDAGDGPVGTTSRWPGGSAEQPPSQREHCQQGTRQKVLLVEVAAGTAPQRRLALQPRQSQQAGDAVYEISKPGVRGQDALRRLRDNGCRHCTCNLGTMQQLELMS